MVRYRMDRRSRLVSIHQYYIQNNRLGNADVRNTIISVNSRRVLKVLMATHYKKPTRREATTSKLE